MCFGGAEMVNKATTADSGPSMGARGEQVAVPPAVSAKPKFQLGVSAVVLYAVYLIVCLSLVLMRHGQLPQIATDVSYMAGQFTAILLFPLALGWVAYRLFKRSNRVGNVIAMVVMAIMAMGEIGLYRNAELDPSTWKDLKRIDAITREFVRASGSSDAAKAAEYREQLDPAWDRLLQNAPMGDRSAVRGSRALNEELVRLVTKYHKALHEFSPLSNVAVAFPSVTVAERLLLLEKAMAAQREWIFYLYRYDDKISEYLGQKGVPAKIIASIKESVASEGRIARTIEILSVDQQMLGLINESLQILHENEGKWSVNEQQELVIHQDFPDELLEKFNATIVRFYALEEEQKRSSTAPTTGDAK